jgi:putative ABC transport system permease protein
MAVAALRRNALRTSLAILGVGIGIAAVIATAALGSGSAARVQSQISALGEDFLWIRAGNRNMSGVRTGSGGARTLTADDASAIANEIPEITMCSPHVTGREQIIAGNQNWNTNYRGVSPAYFAIRDRTAILGTLFSAYDEQQHARVLVLGPTVAERLFGASNPVGQSVRMGRFFFQVVGVLGSKGAGRGGLDRDDAVFVPISTAQLNLNRKIWVNDVMCSVRSPDQMERAEVEAAELLRIRHGIEEDEPDDFEIQKPIETLQLRAETAASLRRLLTGIGGVSLLVGGIGIMNIMLVSVTERRREIGVRLAIGARVRDVRRQFLLEAAGIGFCGGLAGIALGLAGAWLLATGLGAAAVVSWDLMAGVVAVAIGAGLLFGYLPAHRASAVDPIEAMRAES